MNPHEPELHLLMLKSNSGDEAAYRTLLQKLSGLFRRFFRQKLYGRDDAAAEDLVQETLLAIHLNRQRYDPGRPFTAWVYAIARYKLMDHFRRKPAGREFVPVDDVVGLFSEETADQTDFGRDIEVLLAQLPEKQGSAIQLVKLDHLSIREASVKLSISEADVKVSIHRGLKKLMSLVSKEKSS
jgi:RNA polymerase sigma-70 factor (ECF subfamily)